MSHPVKGAVRGAFFWTDVMRFCAAFAVVAEHIRDLLFMTSAEAGPISAPWKAFYFLTGFGHEAVMVFFVLSGFWITSAIARRINEPLFWRGYLVDRLSRLLMVIVPALVLGGLLDFASVSLHSLYASGHSGALTMQEPIADRLGPEVLLGNLLFLQTIAVPTFGSNGPLWSLANEFWYYLWFPALLLLKLRRPGIALATLALAIFSPSLIGGFAVWLMGSTLFYLDRSCMTRGDAPWRPGKGLIVGAAAAALLAALLGASRLNLIPHGSEILVGAAFAGFLWVMLRTDPAAHPAAEPFARYGANASFSLYAMHFPLLAFAAAFVPPGHRAMPDAMRLAMFVAMLLAALCAGWVFSLLTERQTPKIRTALRKRLIQGAPAS